MDADALLLEESLESLMRDNDDDDACDADAEDACDAEEDTAAAAVVVAPRRRAAPRPRPSNAIPREVVRQIARKMIAKSSGGRAVRIDKEGLDALHAAVEAFAVDVFGTSNELVDLAGRTTVTPEFFAAAHRIQTGRPVGKPRAFVPRPVEQNANN